MMPTTHNSYFRLLAVAVLGILFTLNSAAGVSARPLNTRVTRGTTAFCMKVVKNESPEVNVFASAILLDWHHHTLGTIRIKSRLFKSKAIPECSEPTCVKVDKMFGNSENDLYYVSTFDGNEKYLYGDTVSIPIGSELPDPDLPLC